MTFFDPASPLLRLSVRRACSEGRPHQGREPFDNSCQSPPDREGGGSVGHTKVQDALRGFVRRLLRLPEGRGLTEKLIETEVARFNTRNKKYKLEYIRK